MDKELSLACKQPVPPDSADNMALEMSAINANGTQDEIRDAPIDQSNSRAQPLKDVSKDVHNYFQST